MERLIDSLRHKFAFVRVFSFSFGLLFEIDSVSSVSPAFGERSKRRRTFAQKVRIFGREKRSLRSTAGPYSRFASKSSRSLLRLLEESEAVVRVSLTANSEVVRPYPPFIIWLGTRPFVPFGRFDSGSSRTPVFVSVENTKKPSKQDELVRISCKE